MPVPRRRTHTAVLAATAISAALVAVVAATGHGGRLVRLLFPLSDLELLQGEWSISAVRERGRSSRVWGSCIFDGSRMTLRTYEEHLWPRHEVIRVATVILHANHDPRWIDREDDSEVYPGIYQIEGRRLRLCFNESSGVRPTAFRSEGSGPNEVLIVLHR